jgi:MFS family permease
MNTSTKKRDWSKIGRRAGYAISFVLVAGVAAYVSYGHISEVARLAHQPEALARVLPLSVDGLMLIATLAMAEDKAANRMPRVWARVAFWIAAAVSVAANIASTLVHYGWDWIALAVAGWAPIALLLAIEVVARPGKPKAETPAPAIPAPSAEAVPTRVIPEPVVQAQEVVSAEATRLPIPVSPAPQQRPERKPVTRTGPVVAREVVSPLTGRVLTERPPKV